MSGNSPRDSRLILTIYPSDIADIDQIKTRLNNMGEELLQGDVISYGVTEVDIDD